MLKYFKKKLLNDKALSVSEKDDNRFRLVTLLALCLSYCHLRSTVKSARFFLHVYFSDETVSQTTVSDGPMKMFRLEHETMNVSQRNVARFVHVECRFDKLTFTLHG